ncbi:MAG: hypothetical protein RLZZ241_2359 [Bacteroidota bacterium]
MEKSKVSGELKTQINDNLAILEFGHPSGNALNSSLLNGLCSELERLGDHSSVHVILLQSSGDRAFCAGASFDELLQIQSAEESTHFFGGFARLLNAMRNCPKPIVGRIHGKAVGGGVGLVAGCDYVLASADASIRLSELSIGIAPLVIAPAVSRKIGVSGLAELSLSPMEWVSAERAVQLGLYSKIYPNRNALDLQAHSFATQLATYTAASLQSLKSALWENTEHWETLLFERAALTGKLALSETTQNILKKFKEKH